MFLKRVKAPGELSLSPVSITVTTSTVASFRTTLALTTLRAPITVIVFPPGRGIITSITVIVVSSCRGG